MASIGQDLLDVPFSEMVQQLAESVAQAQVNLDKNTVEILKVMGDETQAPVTLPYLQVDDNGNMQDTQITTSMIGAGFQPTFYQFAETVIEVKMAMTATKDTTSNTAARVGTTISRNRYGTTYLRATPIDAKYSNKYNYTQEGSSTLRTRLVPVPPNPLIQKQLELRAEYMQQLMERNATNTNLYNR